MKFELEKNIIIKKNYTIVSFEILSINIKPNVSALLDIMIFCDDDKLYSKQFLLSDQWSNLNTTDLIIKIV